MTKCSIPCEIISHTKTNQDGEKNNAKKWMKNPFNSELQDTTLSRRGSTGFIEGN